MGHDSQYKSVVPPCTSVPHPLSYPSARFLSQTDIQTMKLPCAVYCSSCVVIGALVFILAAWYHHFGGPDTCLDSHARVAKTLLPATRDPAVRTPH